MVVEAGLLPPRTPLDQGLKPEAGNPRCHGVSVGLLTRRTT
jgi:hypothetical protein